MPEDTRKRRRAGRKLTTELLVETSESLTDIDWRLLHWLLRYPLQWADVCRAGNRAGEAEAKGGSGQTHISYRSGGVDDHQGALERARATGPHLVAA